MKILVTGADGFIGSHLVEKLLSSNFEVKALCMYNSFGSMGWLDSIPNYLMSRLEVVFGDIRDLNSVRDAMKDCSHVFHLAALISIPYSYISPASYIDTNIYGTYNVLEAAKELKVRQVIHTSTSEIYGTAQYVPIDEKHPMVGQSPYSATKIAADQLALSFWKSFSTPVSILRPFNTYGPRQSNRAVIPTVITQIISGQKDLKIGKLSPTRDFNFVTDTCNAFIKLLDCKDAIGRVINSASNFEISIGDTVDLIIKTMNANVNIISEEKRFRPSSSEVNRLYGDNHLLKKLTGWEPEYSGLKGFTKGLEITVDWFSNPKNMEKYSSKNFLL